MEPAQGTKVMEAKSPDIRLAMQTRNAILTYLRGEQDLMAVMGAIEAAGDHEAVWHFVRDLDGYGDPQRRESLRRRLEAA